MPEENLLADQIVIEYCFKTKYLLDQFAKQKLQVGD